MLVKHTQRKQYLTDIEADFSFGVSIQAIQDWSSGNPSIPVEANDEKAKWLVFVSPLYPM